jgi:hypothetical protein
VSERPDPQLLVPVEKAQSQYPRVLYKCGHYSDWTQFTSDLAERRINTFIVSSPEQEQQKRAEGFEDAAYWIGESATPKPVPEPMPTAALLMPRKRGRPRKVNVNTL